MTRFLHTRFRVSDLNRTIEFYKKLGFQASEKRTSPQGNQILFLTLPGNDHALEITWSENYKVQVPEDLVHTAIGVQDIIATCDQLESQGIDIWPNGWREKFSKGGMKMAFITDPDGYEVEILER